MHLAVLQAIKHLIVAKLFYQKICCDELKKLFNVALQVILSKFVVCANIFNRFFCVLDCIVQSGSLASSRVLPYSEFLKCYYKINVKIAREINISKVIVGEKTIW